MSNKSKGLLPKEEYWELALEMRKVVNKLVEDSAIDISDTEKYFDIHGITPPNRILYLPHTKQHVLKDYRDNRVRLYKICNYGKPAAKIRFSTKHQYSTQEVDERILRGWIIDREVRLSDLRKVREKAEEEGVALIGDELELDIKDELKALNEIAQNFSQYEIVQSSFFKRYMYTIMNYRHSTGRGEALKSSSCQLIVPKNIKLPIEGAPIHVKMNIVFLDMERVFEPSYNVNRKVESFLSSFDETFKGSTRDLFVKKIK